MRGGEAEGAAGAELGLKWLRQSVTGAAVLLVAMQEGHLAYLLYLGIVQIMSLTQRTLFCGPSKLYLEDLA